MKIFLYCDSVLLSKVSHAIRHGSHAVGSLNTIMVSGGSVTPLKP